MSRDYGTVVFIIPGDAPDPAAGLPVGKTLAVRYGIWGRLPMRTVRDAVRSVKKHVAEVVDERCQGFLTGFNDDGDPVVSPSWEVRLADEQATFRYPYALVQTVGAPTSTGNPRYVDVSQPMNVHLYPSPALDAERALLQAERLRGVIQDAFEFGAARGRELLVPLWDFGGAEGEPEDEEGVYQDSEARQPWDYMRVEGLAIDRLVDPMDDRLFRVIVNFRAQWRRVPLIGPGAHGLPGHLVESVRVTAHPG